MYQTNTRTFFLFFFEKQTHKHERGKGVLRIQALEAQIAILLHLQPVAEPGI